MKNIIFLGILACFGIVFCSILFFKYLFVIDNELHRSVSYNAKKINQYGEYQTYYGYTIVAMIDSTLSEVAEKIEEFLQASVLGRSYSALPASSYHMTIYSIYQCGNLMIPPVARWVNATGNTISNRTFLPDEVLQERHARAMCILDKYLTQPLHIKYASLNIGVRVIKITLEVEEESLKRIRNTREELTKIYEHPDLSMEPIDESLHITLAYIHAPMGQPNLQEWNQLNQLARSFNGAKLLLPSVYLFDSMKNYMPYESKREIKCELLMK